jgi:hypothetical protein
LSPGQIAEDIVESLKAQPFVLVLLVINLVVLAGFAITLREVGKGLARKDAMIQTCITERSRP